MDTQALPQMKVLVEYPACSDHIFMALRYVKKYSKDMVANKYKNEFLVHDLSIDAVINPHTAALCPCGEYAMVKVVEILSDAELAAGVRVIEGKPV